MSTCLHLGETHVQVSHLQLIMGITLQDSNFLVLYLRRELGSGLTRKL